MVSLPNNDNYWCEGWKAAASSSGPNEDLNNDELVISSSSLSTPLSSSSSSSPSPSPSNQSSHYTAHATGGKRRTFTSVDFDSIGDSSFRDSFADKEHLIFYGQDTANSPFILSYKLDSDSDYAGECVRAILRFRETNYLSTIPIHQIEEPLTPYKVITTSSLQRVTANIENYT